MTKQRLFTYMRRTYVVFMAVVSTTFFPYLAILLLQAAICIHAQGGPGSGFVTTVFTIVGLDCFAFIGVCWYWSIKWWNKPILEAG